MTDSTKPTKSTSAAPKAPKAPKRPSNTNLMRVLMQNGPMVQMFVVEAVANAARAALAIPESEFTGPAGWRAAAQTVQDSLA